MKQILLLLAAAAASALGQTPFAQPVEFVTSNPSGACTNGVPLRFNTSNATLWGCAASVWTQISGGGGGTGIITCVAANMSATAPTCTPSSTIAENSAVLFMPDTDSDSGGYTLNGDDVEYDNGDPVGTDYFGAGRWQLLIYDGTKFVILIAQGTGQGAVILTEGDGTKCGTPAMGTGCFYFDATAKTLKAVGDGDEDSTTVVAKDCDALNPGDVVESISAAGVVGCSPPSAVPLTSGTSVTLSGNSRYFVCTGTCTITVPVPSAGVQYCVLNGNNVSTVITLSAIGSGAMYQNTARTAYGTAGTGTLVSGGATGDQVCIVGLDSTHYLTLTYAGTWTAN